MPTTTLTVTTNVNDGLFSGKASISAGVSPTVFASTNGNYATNVVFMRNRLSATGPNVYDMVASWMLFNGITIAQGTTINNATFQFHAARNSSNLHNFNIRVQVDTRSDPSPPLDATSVFGATNKTSVWYKTYQSYIAPSDISSGSNPGSNKAAHGPLNLDATARVQALVNNYDYSNEGMMFYVKPSSYDNGPSLYIYQKDWDTGGNKSPRLIIDFALPVSLVDKTTVEFV